MKLKTYKVADLKQDIQNERHLVWKKKKSEEKHIWTNNFNETPGKENNCCCCCCGFRLFLNGKLV